MFDGILPVSLLRRSAVVGKSLPSVLNISEVFLDLDGTMVPTYETLRAIADAEKTLKKKMNGAYAEICRGDFASMLVEGHGIQRLLHQPLGSTRRAAREILAQRDRKSLGGLKKATQTAMQSFVLYPGVAETLAVLKERGVFVAIYTNSPDIFAVHRLERAGVNPDHIDCIYAKKYTGPLSSAWQEGPFGQKTISYDYQKPDSRPLREVAELTGVRPDGRLFIGEGVSDLHAAFGWNPKNPEALDPSMQNAIFCFQEQGARDIDGRVQEMNARLRPGQEALGFASVNKRIHELGVNPQIIRLRNGFPALLQMIHDGRLQLNPSASCLKWLNDRLRTNGPSASPVQALALK